MSLVTVVWSMIAATCLTLAAVHLPVWWFNREARATLAFSVAALCTAAIACIELVVLKAPTPDVYATAQRWFHVPVAILLVALVGFAYNYLDGALRWLAIVAIGLRLISLVINFSVGQNLNFLEITSLRPIPLLGEMVSHPVGVSNPWMAVGQIAIVLLTLFFAAVSVTTWRRGRRAAAVLVGGSITFLMAASVVRSHVAYWQGGAVPVMTSLFAIGFVVVMGYALSADLLRAKRLVVELSERDQEARLAADAASLGVWTRDVVRDTFAASEKFRELFGFTPDERLSMEQALQRVHADDKAVVLNSFTRADQDGGSYQTEFRIVLPDGRLRWIAALGRVEFDAKGRAIRTRGACIDVTARKTVDQEMLTLREDMAHVGRVAVMGQLSSSLAHEISQPLGAILRNAEAAALFMQQPVPDLTEVSAILDDIRKDDQRAGEVIGRMRSLLRHEKLEMVPIDVGRLISDVATLLHPEAAARHVALRLDVPAELPQVRADKVQIQQVLLNLILNGMDALEGPDHRSRAVAVSARRDGHGNIEISVSDSGLGIAADHLARIFEPFFTTKTKGLGMGLSISRSIVETHGGRLWAENHADGGATFGFTLPIAA